MPIAAAFVLSPDGTLAPCVEWEEAIRAVHDRDNRVWVHVDSPDEADEDRMVELGFHALAILDTVSPDIHYPKVIDYGPYIFAIAHGINYGTSSDLVETTELNLFLGTNYVISSCNEPMAATQSIITEIATGARRMPQSSDILAIAILTAIANNIMPTIDRMADVADDLEEAAIRSPDHQVLENLLKLRRSSARLYRALAPQREGLADLDEPVRDLISEAATHYVRSLYDKIYRLEDRTGNLQDRSDSILAIYMSSVANRQNEVMKTLALVASIFLPMSLVAGIYGMNFHNMPELAWPWAYFAVLGVMAMIGTSIGAAFWFRAWLKWGRRHTERIIPLVGSLPREVFQGTLGSLIPAFGGDEDESEDKNDDK